MTIVIVILHVFVCFFLIAVILLQAGRGQGLSWGVFGSTPQSILGTKTASFLSRVTTGCAIMFLFTCISLNIIETRRSASLVAPRKPISKLDFAKIKEALDQAAKATKAGGTPAPQAPSKSGTAPAEQPPATLPAPVKTEQTQQEQSAQPAPAASSTKPITTS